MEMCMYHLRSSSPMKSCRSSRSLMPMSWKVKSLFLRFVEVSVISPESFRSQSISTISSLRGLRLPCRNSLWKIS